MPRVRQPKKKRFSVNQLYQHSSNIQFPPQSFTTVYCGRSCCAPWESMLTENKRSDKAKDGTLYLFKE